MHSVRHVARLGGSVKHAWRISPLASNAYQVVVVCGQTNYGAQRMHSTSPKVVAPATPVKTIRPVANLTATEVLQQLNIGNKRYVAQQQAGIEGGDRFTQVKLIESLTEKQFSSRGVKAIICGDAHSPHIASVFDADPGDLMAVRIMGTVISPQDAIVGSLEFLFEQQGTPVMIVLSQSQNDVVECAVRLAMQEAGWKGDVPLPDETLRTMNLDLVKLVLPVAHDALIERPSASFKMICELASQLNMWKSIQALVQSSKLIAEAVKEGKLEVHGAYLNNETGKVRFLGKHPSEASLLSDGPSWEKIRTAEDPPVPAAEALAQLYVGNRRYAAGLGGKVQLHDDKTRLLLSQEGQNPIAVVVGCADSRAPIEILFDMRPGDLFVLRAAGNICGKTGYTLGSAEYAIKALGCKLIVVMGHTQCGAVTAALDTARKKEMINDASNIGKVLEQIMESATAALGASPHAQPEEQLSLATRLNVHQTVQNMIEGSDIIRQGVIEGDLQVHGAVYDLFSGAVRWLGQHQHLEQLVRSELPLHQWKMKPYVRTPSSLPLLGEGTAAEALRLLHEGNQRFIRGESKQQTPADKPFAMVLGGGLVMMSIEKIFDVGRGSVLVQRTLGGLQNSSEQVDTPTASIEYAVLRFAPKVFVVLAESNSKLVKLALDQISGAPPPSAPMERVLSDISVSALRAVEQVEKESVRTAAGRERRIRLLTLELDAFYVIEQLMVSKIIRNAVRDGLELHAAMLHEDTGEVEFIGQHPMIGQIRQQFESRDRWISSWADPLDEDYI
eukprot:TRINITY_DN74171_c0_g1_i1.p1 TRINITY_DN74171_c0_g1~~TRINITY_DN74171_c0_g1_i1.p1  ORF type:complete len:785 (-),score=127.33 TRINITY_DN74171_c0_g1_i1:459-2813(-)